MQERNKTAMTEFILLGFGDLPQLQIFFFLVFLVIYLVTMTGNLLIIVLVGTDDQLHTPMYFFLGNLSLLETCYSTTILPKMLDSFLTMDKTISVNGCIAQFFFFGTLAATESCILAAMSYDRYVAICRPLHYATLMSMKFCFQLVSGAWLSSCLASCVFVFQMSKLHFCGPNEIDHFFCDFYPIAKLSCSDTTPMELTIFAFAFMFPVTPCLLTVMFYIRIIATILKIPANIGKQKAFSTCFSHLLVVCIFYGTIIIVYMLPDAPTLRDLNKFFSVFYTVLTPLVNPLIYTLRNREVHKAIKRVCSKLTSSAWIQYVFPFRFSAREV